MKKDVHKDYVALCSASIVPASSEYLFGDLPNLTKDSSEANKLTKKVRPLKTAKEGFFVQRPPTKIEDKERGGLKTSLARTRPSSEKVCTSLRIKLFFFFFKFIFLTNNKLNTNKK